MSKIPSDPHIYEPVLSHPKFDSDPSLQEVPSELLDRLKFQDVVLLKDDLDQWFSVCIYNISPELMIEGMIESEIYNEENWLGYGEMIRFHRDYIYDVLN